MKSAIILFCSCVSFAVLPVLAASTNLTFDGLATATQPGGEQYSPIPNGYGGLQWNNWDVINVNTVQQKSSGYHTGLISPNNVAFNPYGDSASFSATGLFDFDSAYLTSAFDKSTTVEIEGFSGLTRIYDHIYTITSNAPTLINFDYLNVSEVEFVTQGSDWVIVDNLTIGAPDDTDTWSLLAGSVGVCAVAAHVRKIKTRHRA